MRNSSISPRYPHCSTQNSAVLFSTKTSRCCCLLEQHNQLYASQKLIETCPTPLASSWSRSISLLFISSLALSTEMNSQLMLNALFVCAFVSLSYYNNPYYFISSSLFYVALFRVFNLCITYPTISITQYPWHLYSLVSFLVFCSALLPSKSLLSPIHPAQLFLLYSSVLSIVTLSATSVIIGRFQYYTVDCVICLMPFALSSEIRAPVYINLKYGGANFKEFEWWDPSRTHL